MVFDGNSETQLWNSFFRLCFVLGRRGGNAKGNENKEYQEDRACTWVPARPPVLGFWLCSWLFWSRNLNSDQQTCCVKFDQLSGVASHVSNQWHHLMPLKVLAAFPIVSEHPLNSWWCWTVPDAKPMREESFRITPFCVRWESHLPHWFRGTICSSWEKMAPHLHPGDDHWEDFWDWWFHMLLRKGWTARADIIGPWICCHYTLHIIKRYSWTYHPTENWKHQW